MELFPAIDIKDKKAVRLLQGDYDKVTVFSENPADIALEFKNAGAKNLHLVDLDGAKDGQLSNFDTVHNIIKSTDLFVEIGGGIRDEERIKKYFDIGVGRVILGTAALENPDFLNDMVVKYGEKIAVGIDAKNGCVATHGWLNVSDVDSVKFCEQVRDMGVKTVIYTDISKDGAMQGTNLDIYKRLSEIDGLNIVASGGITYYEEIEKLRDMNIYGAILGKALYLGAIDLKKALEVAK